MLMAFKRTWGTRKLGLGLGVVQRGVPPLNISIPVFLSVSVWMRLSLRAYLGSRVPKP